MRTAILAGRIAVVRSGFWLFFAENGELAVTLCSLATGLLGQRLGQKKHPMQANGIAGPASVSLKSRMSSGCKSSKSGVENLELLRIWTSLRVFLAGGKRQA